MTREGKRKSKIGDFAIDYSILSDMLGLVMDPAPTAIDLKQFTGVELQAAERWAAREHLAANDNPVRRLKKPKRIEKWEADARCPPTFMLRLSWSWSRGPEEDRFMHWGPLADTGYEGRDAPPSELEIQRLTYDLKQAWLKMMRARKRKAVAG